LISEPLAEFEEPIAGNSAAWPVHGVPGQEFHEQTAGSSPGACRRSWTALSFATSPPVGVGEHDAFVQFGNRGEHGGGKRHVADGGNSSGKATWKPVTRSSSCLRET